VVWNLLLQADSEGPSLISPVASWHTNIWTCGVKLRVVDAIAKTPQHFSGCVIIIFGKNGTSQIGL
jgi:hypothetical protein